ncbi:MAG TPA: TraR/DksA C4-type zinc finger protein [Acidimicrobiales bacterium]
MDDAEALPAAAVAAERDQETSFVAGVQSALAEVDAALERLDAGSYGRCEVCGDEIADERLAAAPTARTCASHDAPTG